MTEVSLALAVIAAIQAVGLIAIAALLAKKDK